MPNINARRFIPPAAPCLPALLRYCRTCSQQHAQGAKQGKPATHGYGQALRGEVA
jgi:hypothetical protein